MRARSFLAGLAIATVAGSTASVVAVAPALADPGNTPGQTPWVPDANDLVGVGSDTTENLMDFLLDGGDSTHTTGLSGYNAGLTAADVRVASFDTVGSATIVLRQGSAPITRPVGSGTGKGMLYGTGNNPDVTFARSSSAINSTEKANGLEAFPYALDSLKMAVASGADGTPATHAPGSLTGAQILGIYKGDFTTWDQVGGTSTATIKPYIPQSGSGTANFFMAQLVALNGGNPVTLGANVDNTMHENTDDVFKNGAADPANAIAPFSVAKQTLLYSSSPTATVHLEDGYTAQRAVYNVVRGTDLANADVQNVFGETGFICSTAARALIEAAGFQQLATPAHGGVCGQATQDPTSNFALNQQVITKTKLAASSPAATKAKLVATVTGSTAPSGHVDFYEGATLLTSNVPLVSGQATSTVTRSPGNHTLTAKFVPDASNFDPSQASKSVFVKAKSTISETFPATVAKGARAKGVVKVTLTGISNKATGMVKVVQGRKLLASGRLAQGKVTITLPQLTKGKHALTATWAGDSHGVAATKRFTITQK